MHARRIMIAGAVVLCATSAAYAAYSFSDDGRWPKDWPKELEPLRKQSRSFVGPDAGSRHYAISFSDCEAFVAAWPHILSVKSKGSPIFLSKGPNFFLGDNSRSGVIVHCPPEGQWDNPATPEAPLEEIESPRGRWAYTIYVELVVDGKIVDLNQTPIPADTPIVDERFEQALGSKRPGGDN